MGFLGVYFCLTDAPLFSRRVLAVSSISREFFLALGAGDGDLSLSPGNTDGLPTLGTVKVAMLTVFQPLKELPKLPILLIAPVGIPGQAAKDGPKHQHIGQRPQNQLDHHTGDEGIHQHQHQTRA